MFPSPKTGGMYHPDSIVNLHKKILKDAGLPHIRFHDLRHTFATVALQNGVDVKTVSNMLGHYDAGFTLRTYTHATRQMQESAAEKMGSFMERYCKKKNTGARRQCAPVFLLIPDRTKSPGICSKFLKWRQSQCR